MPDFSNHFTHINSTHFLQSTTSSQSDLPLSNQQSKTMSPPDIVFVFIGYMYIATLNFLFTSKSKYFRTNIIDNQMFESALVSLSVSGSTVYYIQYKEKYYWFRAYVVQQSASPISDAKQNLAWLVLGQETWGIPYAVSLRPSVQGVSLPLDRDDWIGSSIPTTLHRTNDLENRCMVSLRQLHKIRCEKLYI